MKEKDLDKTIRSLSLKHDIRIDVNNKVISMLDSSSKNAQHDIGIKSLGNIDFLRTQGYSVEKVHEFINQNKTKKQDGNNNHKHDDILSNHNASKDIKSKKRRVQKSVDNKSSQKISSFTLTKKIK